MPIYYFHVSDGPVHIPDEVGRELLGLRAARKAARQRARKLADNWRADFGTGSIQIEDSRGFLVDSIPIHPLLN
jgi:hypothetical protein